MLFPSSESQGLPSSLEAYEGLLLAELGSCKGNRSEAARRLGIGRVTLLDKMKKHGFSGSDSDTDPRRLHLPNSRPRPRWKRPPTLNSSQLSDEAVGMDTRPKSRTRPRSLSR